MNYRELFQRVISLLSAPSKAWTEIIEDEEAEKVVSSFVYPLIGLCGMTTFIGAFIGKGMSADVFQVALTQCCAVAVSLFGGYFLAVYLLKSLALKWLKIDIPRDTMLVFVGYSMVVTFVLNIFSALFAIMILHWILQIYTIVVAFEGGRRLLQLKEEKQSSFAVLATIIILLCPSIIGFVFNKLSVILN